ncbi:MAG: hypothetical protein M1818_001930 [Claussenomyces sp. TS43310]|nr:MAG: hypothetical protein M1818_001930 [Claussenomyces sp. TS43310]
MLRRKPTAIHLTAEDIASYEDRQAAAIAQAHATALAQAQAEAQLQAQAEYRRAQQAQTTPQNRNLNERGVSGQMPAVPVKERVKTREERLGIGESSRR